MAQQTFDGSLFFARIVLALGKRQNHLSSLFFYVVSLLSETEENSSFSVHTQNGAFIRWNTHTTAVRIRTTTLFEEGKNVLDDNLTPVPSNPQSDENVPVQKQKRFVQRNPTRVSGKFKVVAVAWDTQLDVVSKMSFADATLIDLGTWKEHVARVLAGVDDNTSIVNNRMDRGIPKKNL